MRHLLSIVVCGLLCGATVAQSAQPSNGNATGSKVPAYATVKVDCSKGDSLSAALATPALDLRVEFSGTCTEDVTIDRGQVTLVGATPGAAIAGSGAAAESVLSIHGGSPIALSSFRVYDGGNFGLDIDSTAGVLADHLEVNDNRNGIIMQGSSSLVLTDSSVSSNSGVGIVVFNSSNLRIGGAVDVSNNGRWGVYVAYASMADTGASGGTFTCDNNGGVGILIWDGSVDFTYGSVELSHNLSGATVWSNGELTLDNGSTVISGNVNFGLRIRRSSKLSIDAPATIASNGMDGVALENGSSAVLAYDEIADNAGKGVSVDGGSVQMAGSELTGNTAGDLSLGFGAHGDFQGGNSAGSVSCDGTVLVRGDLACP